VESVVGRNKTKTKQKFTEKETKKKSKKNVPAFVYCSGTQR
jgi:hypothetical protein